MFSCQQCQKNQDGSCSNVIKVQLDFTYYTEIHQGTDSDITTGICILHKLYLRVVLCRYIKK